MDRVNASSMVSLVEGGDSEIVTVPCVSRLASSRNVRPESISESGRNKTIVNEKLKLDSLRLVSRAYRPSFNRTGSRLAPSFEIWRKSFEEEGDRERGHQ